MSAVVDNGGLKAAATKAGKKKEQRDKPKAVQIRRGWTAGEPKRLDFCVLQVCLAVQVVLGAVLKGERKMQRQLAVMQADQGWWSFKRCIQPGLQIAVDKELLA